MGRQLFDWDTRNPEAVPENTDQLLDSADTFIENARRLQSESQELIKKSQEEAHHARFQVSQAFVESTAEMQDIGRELKYQAVEVDRTLMIAKQTLKETMKKVDTKDRRKMDMMKTTWQRVSNLEQTRRRLHCEIKQKEAVRIIDETCRKITPTVASVRRRRPVSASLLRRASSAPSLAPEVTMSQSQARRRFPPLDAETSPSINVC